MERRIMNILMILFQGIFGISMLWVFILTVKRNILTVPIAIVVFLLCVFIIKQYMHKQRNEQWYSKKWYFILLWIFSSFIMIYLAFQLKVDIYDTWDYGKIIRSAYEWATQGTITAPEYYIRYSNNQFVLLVVSIIMKITVKFAPSADIYFCQDITIITNVILIELSIGVTHLIGKKILPEKVSFLADIFIIGCSPLYLYACMMYTDTLALLPIMMITYSMINAEQAIEKECFSKIAIWFAVAGGWAAIGYYVKLTVVFCCIGIFIYIFLKWPWKKLLIGVVCFFIGFSIIFAGTKKIIYLQSNYSEEQYDLYQFPYVHWIMMALEKDGRYNQEDVDYTFSFDSKEAKKEADIERIKERINEMGFSGVLIHSFYEKVYHAWTQGAVSVDDYVSRKPISPGLGQQIFAYNGKYYKVYQSYVQSYWLLLITGFLISVIGYFKNREMQVIHGLEIAVFGLFLFLLVWESNPRYLMHFLLIFCLISAYGYGIIQKDWAIK